MFPPALIVTALYYYSYRLACHIACACLVSFCLRYQALKGDKRSKGGNRSKFDSLVGLLSIQSPLKGKEPASWREGRVFFGSPACNITGSEPTLHFAHLANDSTPKNPYIPPAL